ncbi:MAG: diguanylate cyclase [Clostridia bacterium]|nr:diguanylate cyclase [Clostridia bacterium]
MNLINHRYRILENITTDSFGDVFLVEDIFRETLCYLRLFSVDFTQNDLIKHYKSNFVRYSTMVHPNLYQDYKFDIVTTLDGKKSLRRQFFYTYERPAESTVHYMDLNRQEAIEVLIEICKALRYLHFRGYVYKYLSFENIHIYRNDENRLSIKLVDLASLQLFKDILKQEKTQNQFIAPEIFWKEMHNIQADIYSLGVVFYFLYHRSSYNHKIVDENLRKNIKNAVDKIVAQMIRISVIDEINSVDEFLSILKNMLNISIVYDDYDYFNKLQLKAPILERFNETTFFNEVVHEKFSRNSDYNAVLIVGDMGTGKTRVLDEAQTILKWEGYRVIRVDCEEDRIYNYDVFKSILVQIIEFGDISQELIIKYGSELIKLLPEYKHLWNVSPAESLSEPVEQLRIKNRLHNFLREYSSIHRIVIVLDGIHHLNDDQMDLLNYLMMDKKENQYFIIASYENDSVLSNRIANWEDMKKIYIKHLINFNYDQASHFVSSILGVGYNPIELTAKVMRDAHGNLKLIKDIIKSLFDKGYIYVNSHNEWVLNDQYDEFDNSNIMKVRSDFEKEIQYIPYGSMAILELIALFKEAAPLECIVNLIELKPSLTKQLLNELSNQNILKMKFDDQGETYDYCSRSLKRTLAEELEKGKKEKLHIRIAEFFENRIDQDKFQYMESLIHHFSNGNDKNKSVKYCNVLAVEMERQNMYMQAVELYNRALGILHTQERTGEIGRHYYEISRIYDLIGESELSKNIVYKGMDIAKEFGDKVVEMKCMILLAKHFVKRRDIARADQMLKDLRLNLEESDVISLNYETYHVEMQLLLAENNLFEARALLDTILDEMPKGYKSIFLNHLGTIELREGNLGEALKAFEASVNFLSQSTYHHLIESLYPQNNIGLLYSFYLDEIQKGRTYFSKAIEMTESKNLSQGTALFVRNLGETYLIEDRFDLAFIAFSKALEIVEKTMDSFVRADVCRMLCMLYIKTENYQKASFYLKKLESEYEDYNNNAFVNVEFYLIHIEYFLHVKDYDLASQWCKRLRNSDVILEEKEEFILRVLEYEVEVFRKQYFNYTANIDLRFVEVLVKTQTNMVEAKAVRSLILRLATNLMNYKKYIDVHFLLKLDEDLTQIFDTPFLAMKHKVLKGVLKDDRITYFNELLIREEHQLTQEDKWLIYKILGDEHYDTYDYYHGIQCYFNSFHILRNLAELLPKENKENYIFCDEVKLDLKSKVNNIHRKLVGQSYKEKTVYTELEIRKADDFFDLSDYKNFVQNKSIQNSISEIYEEKHGVVLNSVNDLIRNFGKNEIRNIQLILKYCTQILMGERGFIYILDEDNRISEIVKTNDEHDLPDLDMILKSSVNINEGLLVNMVYDSVRNFPFIDNQKGLLCIPITKNEHILEKRRENDLEEHNIEVKGYMYIDASEAFNNFTIEPFTECLSLMNMLYFFVDNYNLKKVSTIDKLTNVYLRSYFEDLFSRTLHRSKLNGNSLAVVMLDIDKFKAINDTYGHRKGDEILTNMCQVIKNNIRDTDLIGRYGGEEFVLVFPNTNKETAYMICEKIRTAVKNSNFLKDDRDVTISLGISTFPELGLVEEELIEKADQALYASKNSGRNRTTVWTPDLGENQLRFDKLAGILEGNISTDTRNVQAIVDIMNTVKSKTNYEEKLELILKTISDVCEAQKISLIKLESGKIMNVSTKFTGEDIISNQMIISEQMVKTFAKKESAEYFINWNDISELDDKNVPDWKSMIISPLKYKDLNKGLLVVSVPIATKEFSFNTTNFVNVISGVIATIL